ncbi:MAG: response regulator [Candidatus Kapabacteria bacterium]|nr:response regulator [Candidatus Kapabacteria bacterium]
MKKRILIVDDSIISRKKIRGMLLPQFFEITEAVNGRQALELIFEQPFDCILLDLLMPEVEGQEVLEQMRDRGIKIPTIVLSADIQETTRTQCLNLGAIDFINKPPLPDHLINVIKLALNMN